MLSRTSTAAPAVTLEGVVERVVYLNEETGFSVLRLLASSPAAPGSRAPGIDPGRVVTVVGNLLGIQPGESLRLWGSWVNDRDYGEQFRAARYLSIQPATVAGIERYLGSGLVRGLGRRLASRLVEHFGTATLEVIEGQPDRLTEVPGIGPVRSQRIQAAWQEQREIKEVMIFLQSHGVSTAFAVRIYKRYGQRAVEVVRKNPYQLALDIFGIGFLTADRIAANLGIARDSPRRAEAAVMHVLGELGDEGHLFGTRSALVDQTVTLLCGEGVAPEPAAREALAHLVEKAIAELARLGRVVVEPAGEAAELPEADAVYLAPLYTAESAAAARLRELCAAPAAELHLDLGRAIAWLEEKQGLQLAPAQREAVARATRAKLLVITGGPGTGKTTLLNGIIRILEKKGRRILLCAPTGRAAKRLAETTQRETRTIHRLLELSPRQQGFVRNASHPLEADLVIVDEVSMVDQVLFHHLCAAVPLAAQLVLVGDVDQLPSVGPGAVLAEVIRSGLAEVVTLTEVFRQAAQSLIVVNAHRVNRGELPRGAAPAPGSGPGAGDFFFIERQAPEEVVATIKLLCAERIPRSFGVDAVDDVQVLTPMNRGSLGAGQLNAELQALLNPGGQTLVRGSRLFRVGDKVMQVRNNYDLDVYNGDIGRLVSVDPVERTAVVRFDEREVAYEPGDLDDLVLAYACTIHKSQGSEYPVVVIPVHTQHYVMLQRNLFYTALTRARRLAVMVGTKRALAMAVKNHRVQARATRLAERLAR